MKAIICDTCGRSVPASAEAEILPLKITYGVVHVKNIERDICPVCLKKLVLFFDPEKTETEAADTEFKTHPKPGPEPVTNFEIHVDYADGPDSGTVKSSYKKFVPVTGIRPDNSKPGTRIAICANPKCAKQFEPKTKKSTTCCKQCAQQAWIAKQKHKEQDDLLAKLKKENPIIETSEPEIYRHM